MMEYQRESAAGSAMSSNHLPMINQRGAYVNSSQLLNIQGTLDISESDAHSILAPKKKKKKKVKRMKTGQLEDDDMNLQDEIDKIQNPSDSDKGLSIKPDGLDKKEMEMKRVV
jgi:hypothetical protein